MDLFFLFFAIVCAGIGLILGHWMTFCMGFFLLGVSLRYTLIIAFNVWIKK